jgi:hypothetical protein
MPTMKRIHRNHMFANRVIDFFIIGAQKSGTTSLYDHLAQHPQIFLPQVKETRFFHERAVYERGPSWLAPLYRSAPEAALLGGADVHTLFFPEAAWRLHDHNPRMKLLAVLRNPVDRAYSAYWYNRLNGWESCRTFEEALALESQRSRGSYTERAVLTILGHGHYAEQLQRFYSLFGASNLLVLLTEDLAPDHVRDTLSRTMRWLGVDPNAIQMNPSRRLNVAGTPRSRGLQRILMSYDTWYRRVLRSIMTPSARFKLQQFVVEPLNTRNVKSFKYPEMNPQTRNKLLKYYAPLNKILSDLIARDLTHWSK